MRRKTTRFHVKQNKMTNLFVDQTSLAEEIDNRLHPCHGRRHRSDQQFFTKIVTSMNPSKNPSITIFVFSTIIASFLIAPGISLKVDGKYNALFSWQKEFVHNSFTHSSYDIRHSHPIISITLVNQFNLQILCFVHPELVVAMSRAARLNSFTFCQTMATSLENSFARFQHRLRSLCSSSMPFFGDNFRFLEGIDFCRRHRVRNVVCLVSLSQNLLSQRHFSFLSSDNDCNAAHFLQRWFQSSILAASFLFMQLFFQSLFLSYFLFLFSHSPSYASSYKISLVSVQWSSCPTIRTTVNHVLIERQEDEIIAGRGTEDN